MASLRATATMATWRPRRAATRPPKARSGPGVRMAAWAASQSAARAAAGPSLEMWPMRAAACARLAHARIEAEVADQLAGRAKAVHVADHGDEGGRAQQADAGDRHQAADLGRGQGVAGDGRSKRAISPSRKAIVRRQLCERLALVGGQLERLQPAPPGDAEEIGRLTARRRGCERGPRGPRS